MRALAALLLLGAVACAAPQRPLPDPAEPDSHAALGVSVAEVMRELSTLADDRLPKAMDVGVLETERRREVGSLAVAMAEAAEAIPAAAPSARLTPAERAEFAKLARRLADEARALAAAARTDGQEDLAPRVEAIRSTCNACHLRFRIPGAPGER